jgi:CheY-like chemotaxis protein
VAALVRRAVEELRGAHPERQIDVGGLDQCFTTGDADRLLQLFSNLIANALHHGDPRIPVSVEVGSSAREATITVHNAGAIPAELMPTLFDPFRRRWGIRSSSKGLGLGLYITQQIAEAHGGTVSVSSSAEAGTTFTVRLPHRAADDASPERGMRNKKVLVVDDDRDTRESLQEAFEDEGYSALTAANGREALAKLADATSRPDVVVLDIAMPVMDGNRVYETMRADPDLARIPVVASTSSPETAPPGVVVVPKPFKLDRLLQTVAVLCQSEPR